ncbi:MAG: 1,2-phenylacetyl-CoA epoxidase subunit PaaD, partial [Candidatus Paceibacterota bacterium]
MTFHLSNQDIWQLLEQVKDPEVPVLSIIDLGIVRRVEWNNNLFEIDITPTYTGCPAMNTIEADIKLLFEKNNIPCQVKLVLSPAWTTDWMSKSGKDKLKAYGIAPPQDEDISIDTLFGSPKGIICPLC